MRLRTGEFNQMNQLRGSGWGEMIEGYCCIQLALMLQPPEGGSNSWPPIHVEREGE